MIITVLGIGAMGFPMARRLCEAGHVVHVWNRSRDKAERLTPFGGLYTVVDIGTNADEFVPKALKATGVLVVPGGGFGESLKNGVRISFGPLVKDTAKIDEGLARLGTWMRGTQAP